MEGVANKISGKTQSSKLKPWLSYLNEPEAEYSTMNVVGIESARFNEMVHSIQRNLKGREERTKLLVELKQAQAMLDLEEDWDGLGARKISTALFNLMKKSVISYSKRVHPVCLSGLDVEVGAVPDGSIDVAWYGPKARLLMNFKEKDHQPWLYFYATRQDESENIKGKLDPSRTEEFLVTWMNTNLIG